MKEYTLIQVRKGKEREIKGTLPYLSEYFSYTLKCGQSWEHERGNKKINLQPKTIKSLITNVNNALNNSARNGWADEYYYLKED